MNGRSLGLAFIDKVREIYGTRNAVPLHAPTFSEREEDAVARAVESTFVSSIGPDIEVFEQSIAEVTGAKHVVAVSSGTAALHVALLTQGVGHRDEVITSPITFVATCNAIAYCGADPVFVDIEGETLGMSPSALAEFLTEFGEVRDDGICWNKASGRKIRVCLPVHNLGHPARVAEIKTICDQFKISVVEDAAESLGSLQGGKHTGLIGEVGTLSFNGNKIITTGGGGALITNASELATELKHLTTTAKRAHPWLFHHDRVGFNYRLPNLNAALGVMQIERLDDFVSKKRRLAQEYSGWFKGQSQGEFFLEPDRARSNYWLNAIALTDQEERDDFLKVTNDAGVMTRPMWTPMHTLPMFKDCLRSNLQNAEEIAATFVNLPSSVVSLDSA